MTEFDFLCLPQREGELPDAKIRCYSLGSRHRDRNVPSAFYINCSQIELPALHRRHFGGLPTALGQEELPRSYLVPATRLCALSSFQAHPVLDLEENRLIHKQGCLTCKEP